MKRLLHFLVSCLLALTLLPTHSSAQITLKRSLAKTGSPGVATGSKTQGNLPLAGQSGPAALSTINPNPSTYCNIAITGVVNDVACKGAWTGSIKLAVNNCYGYVTYKWSDGATSKDRTGLKAGTYTVTVTDKGNYYTCSAVKTFTVSEPSTAVAVSGVVINASLGATNGSINITASGGTAPYTYKWSDGPTTADRTGLGAGTYTVTVYDAKGCKATKSFTVYCLACKLAASGVTKNVDCHGGNNGTITLTVSGATGAVSYQWSDGSTLQNRTGLPAGTYSVTITDKGITDCKITKSFTITQPAPVSVAGTVVNVAATGLNNGSIDITVTGGTPPYAFKWSDGPTTEDRTGLAPGNYTVTVTDAKGCQVTKTFTIGVITCNLVVTPTINHVSCFGGNNGAITLTVTGGTGPYTFQWSDGSTAQNRTALTAGTYSVTVTDQSTGCKTTQNIVIYQPAAAISVNGQTVDASGVLNNGSITLLVDGGTPPYTYLWNDGVTTPNRSNLAPGTYTVTVTDANGCKAQKPFTIGSKCNLSITDYVQNVYCPGTATGSIQIGVTGAAGQLLYQWSDGVSGSASRSGLIPGTYVLTVTDLGSQCKAVRSFTITEPAPISVIGVVGNITQVGVNNGSITLTVTGGTPPYRFQWNDGVTTQNRTGLAPGTYTVTVSDSRGCPVNKTFTVSGISCNIVVTPTVNHVSCLAGSNGAITLAVTGGGPYTFLWNDGATTQNRFGLVAGNYSVTITDQSNRCATSRSFTLYQPASAINISGVTISVTGGLSNGAIDITVSGGTPPYSYSWSDGATTEDRTNLAAATYVLTVTDANGCQATKPFTVNGTTCNLVINGYTQDVNCNGAATGSIVITSVTGAVGMLAYSWNDGTTTASRTNLPAGTYTVTVTDQTTQCKTTRSFVINQPPALTIGGVVVNASSGLNNGSIDITVTGGTLPYSFKWSDGPTTEDRTGLAPGSYTVTVTDARGCVAVKTFTVGGSACTLGVTGVVTNTSCYGVGDGKITLTVTGNVGPVTFLWNDGATTQNRSNLVVGWYQVTVIDQTTKCKVVQSFNIGQPTQLTYKAVVTDVSVAGASDGSIVSYISGGTPPYTIQWNDGATALNRSSLPAGAYTITIVDSKGCNIAYCVYVRIKGQCNLLTVTGNITSTCGCGANDGTINLTVSGGTAPYTFQWSDGPTTQNRTGLAAGTYTVTVTDAVSCTKTVSFTVTTAIIYNLTTVSLADKKPSAEAARGLSATVAPNPTTTGLVKLVVTSPVNTTATVNVLDMSGRKMMGSAFSLTKGINYKELNLSGNASGLYSIELLTNGERKVLKVAVHN